MIVALLTALALASDVELPQVLDDRLQLQLVAAEPGVVTPTGIAVDAKGRVLVIESHTHFRPEGYQGPPADRILLMDDFYSASGKARQISVFFEGTKHAMNLAIYHDGSVYVATRMEILRLRDKDGNGQADERTPICHLETPGNYPHNGLSGLAFDLAGNIYFGFGENLGAEYKLIGSDGKTLFGGGEGGNIYCCDAEGKNLRRVATGFWNPFGMCFDAFGRLFAVDNDPDSRPPCRLLHIVEGGDYGFRFRNGRKGVHPFTAWNGELPGTLPMVCGTGEAPSAVLAYESDNLPAEYRGDLLVTSWGDHRLERYRLRPRGASFSAEMTPILRGNQNFRPVGLALAPDGSLFISDWVDKSYPLHEKGRVWRLSAKNPPQLDRPDDPILALSSLHGPWREAAAKQLSPEQVLDVAAKSQDQRSRSLATRQFAPPGLATWMGLFAAQAPGRFTATMDLWRRAAESRSKDDLMDELVRRFDQEPLVEVRAALMRSAFPLPTMLQDLDSNDPFLLQAAVCGFSEALKSKPMDLAAFEEKFVALDENRVPKVAQMWEVNGNRGAWGWALVVRSLGTEKLAALVPQTMLYSKDTRVQLIGLQWIAERRDESQRKNVEGLVARARSRQVFEAALATLDILDRGYGTNPRVETAGDALIARILADPGASTSVRRLAMRSLRSDHPIWSMELLTQLLDDPRQEIRLEAIRTLRQRPEVQWWPPLREIAAGENISAQERCDAILGLSSENDKDRRMLVELAKSDVAQVSAEAKRALRSSNFVDLARQQPIQRRAKFLDANKEPAERALTQSSSSLPQREDIASWLARAEGAGDPEVGERIFFHSRIGGCFRCHEFEGRGNTVGPDLSTIGRSMTRERLVQSIIDPSREIAPQFTSYAIRLASGEVLTGLHVGDEVDGRMRFADQTGRLFHVHPNDIDQRQPSTQSIMPNGLADNLTAQELRDLLAFLLRK